MEKEKSKVTPSLYFEQMVMPFLKQGNKGIAVCGEAVAIGIKDNEFNFWHAELEVPERHLTIYAHESICGYMDLRGGLRWGGLWIHSHMCNIWFLKIRMWDEITQG